MTTIIQLTTAPKATQVDTILLLEAALAAALAGELQEVAIIGIKADRDLYTEHSSLTDRHKIIGALEVLKFILLSHEN
jgi:hypothetical protein